jgi:RNA polymerase sigma-70 factor (ECF subfamily)
MAILNEAALEERHALSDGEIVARVRAGDVELFELLMRRYNQRLYRVAWSVLRNDTQAEDVVQETWVRAFAHLDQFEERARFSTWLTRIALYEAWSRARRGRRFVPFGPEAHGEANFMSDPISEENDPEARAAERETARALEAAIERLPDRYRGVFMLREIEELSTAETAECLELSEEAVKTRLHRARGLLRRELSGVAPAHARIYPFLGARCDRMVERVVARIRSLSVG